MLRWCLGALAVLLPLSASGQPLTLSPRDDANDLLPASVRAFDVTRAGTPLRASLVRADLAAADWDLEAVLSDVGSETVPSFASDADVLVAVNAGYFGGGQSYSLVLEGGQTLVSNIGALTRSGTVYYPTRGAFGVSASRTPDVAWVYTLDGATYAYPQPSPNAPGAPEPRPTPSFPDGGAVWDIASAVGGGPVLVRDGRASLTWTEEVFFGGSGVDTTTARARTAVGYTAGGSLLVVAVPEATGLTLPQLAVLMVDLGAVEAVNLDGGGSTALSVGSVALVSSTRPVVSALRLRRPSSETPVGTVFDSGDACCYRETGAWFESANAPYFGASRSRLNEVGEGADRATFVFDGIEAGAYVVEAWWVPAANRAIDAPFTVYAGGEGRTVRVDQTDLSTAGQWTPLETFQLAPGDSLVVTDDASGTASPAYVSVDAVRLVSVAPSAAGDEPPARAALRIWPNPAADVVSVSADVDGPGRVEVVSALGRVVRQFDVPPSPDRLRAVIDVAGLAPGVYAVRVSGPGDERVGRLTVLR